MSVDALLDAAGTALPDSNWMIIDQDRVDEFARATGDFQWIHVDVDRARGGPFGGTIVHGYLTLSLIGPLVADVLTVDNASSVLNYGLEKVRFPAPLPVGARVRMASSIGSVVEVAGGVQVGLRCALQSDQSPRPVCVASPVYRFLS